MGIKEPEKIKKMFDEIAPRYDFMNNVISVGLHGYVKKKAVNTLNFKKITRVLDLCTGTGDIAKILANKKEIESVYAVDFSSKMLDIALKKNPHNKIKYINADCLNLPFEDNSFDAVTMFFGLRNIEDTIGAIKEIYRVLKPEGQFLHFDFQNENILFDKAFRFFTPFFAGIFAKNQESYKYLVKTKEEFFKQEELKKIMREHNLKPVKAHSFLFSTVCANVFEKE